mgnify:FL=1
MIYDYFYGAESEMFSFFRIPRNLIFDPHFKPLSTDAKLLYGLLLDRMSLSAANQWLDDAGRVYIYFPVSEVEEKMNCGHEKAGKMLRELDGIGLIERVKRGQGKPTIIYVKQFIGTEDNCAQSRHPKSSGADIRKSEVLATENHPPRQPVSGGQDIRKPNGNYNKYNQNNQNYTYSSYTDPSILLSAESDGDDFDPMMDEMDGFDDDSEESIRERIEYEPLTESYDAKLVDNVVSIICDVLTTPQETYHINKRDIDGSRVIERFRRLDRILVEYVLDKYLKTPKRKKNIRGYLISMLYNAEPTIELDTMDAVLRDKEGAD